MNNGKIRRKLKRIFLKRSLIESEKIIYSDGKGPTHI